MIALVRSALQIQCVGRRPELGAPAGAQQRGMEAVPEVRADSPATAVRLVAMPTQLVTDVELLAGSVIWNT